MDEYFLPGKPQDYERPQQPVCCSWNASGLCFRLVDRCFDSDRIAAAIRDLIHSLAVPPRSDKHALEGFGESASLRVIRNADDSDLLSAKRRKTLYERVSLGRGKLSIGWLSLKCADLASGSFRLFFQLLDLRRMERFCLIYFPLLLLSTSAIGDGSQSIRSPAVNECKYLAQGQKKDEYQCGEVKPPIPVGGGFQRVPSGENSHGYVNLLTAWIKHQSSCSNMKP